jgi:hypothetical protein
MAAGQDGDQAGQDIDTHEQTGIRKHLAKGLVKAGQQRIDAGAGLPGFALECRQVFEFMPVETVSPKGDAAGAQEECDSGQPPKVSGPICTH